MERKRKCLYFRMIVRAGQLIQGRPRIPECRKAWAKSRCSAPPAKNKSASQWPLQAGAFGIDFLGHHSCLHCASTRASRLCRPYRPGEFVWTHTWAFSPGCHLGGPSVLALEWGIRGHSIHFRAASAARQRYQAAMVACGRQRRPNLSRSLGLGSARFL